MQQGAIASVSLDSAERARVELLIRQLLSSPLPLNNRQRRRRTRRRSSNSKFPDKTSLRRKGTVDFCGLRRFIHFAADDDDDGRRRRN